MNKSKIKSVIKNMERNIFNIFNRSDYITMFPGLFIPESISPWERHGIDIPIAMTVGSDIAENHMMATYLGWMEAQEPDLTWEGINAISENDVRMGKLPWIVKFKCPVAVSVYDDEGTEIAFESQQENTPSDDEVGAQGGAGNTFENNVVSWITTDGAKMFFLPYGSVGDVATITAQAYDYGSMTFSVSAIDASENTASESKVYTYVNLYPMKEFKVELTENTTIDDVQLLYKTDGGIYMPVENLNPPLKSAVASPQIVDYGTESTIIVVTDLSVSAIRLTERESGQTHSYDEDNAQVESDGETLSWTVRHTFSPGTYTFDVGTETDGTWTTVQNVFTLTVNSDET